MPPGDCQRVLQLRDGEGGEFRRRCAARAPGIGNGRESIRRELALERLLVWSEHQVGGLAVGRKRRVDAPHLEIGQAGTTILRR